MLRDIVRRRRRIDICCAVYDIMQIESDSIDSKLGGVEKSDVYQIDK